MADMDYDRAISPWGETASERKGRGGRLHENLEIMHSLWLLASEELGPYESATRGKDVQSRFFRCLVYQLSPKHKLKHTSCADNTIRCQLGQ